MTTGNTFTAAEQAEIDRFCAERGTDVRKKQDQQGNTLLHIAAMADVGLVGVVKFLISKGADVNAKSNDLFTPLHAVALTSGNVKVGNILISSGANVNAKYKGGGTPLYSAVGRDNVEFAKFLVSKGADINARDDGGNTPLDYAKRKGCMAAVQYLTSIGAESPIAKLGEAARRLRW